MRSLSRVRRWGPLLIGAAAAGALLWPVWPGLEVGPEGRPACHLPLTDQQPFGLSFLHSVDGLPVQDWYHVEDDRIVQDATRLRQFGAGMGHIDGAGRGRAVDGWWEVGDLRRPIGTLVIRVGGPSVDHRLHHPDGVLALSERWSHTRVVIRPWRRSTLHRVLAPLLGPDCPVRPDPAAAR